MTDQERSVLEQQVAKRVAQASTLEQQLWRARELEARTRRTHAQVVALVKMATRSPEKRDELLARALEVHEREWPHPPAA